MGGAPQHRFVGGGAAGGGASGRSDVGELAYGGAWLCRHLWEHYEFGRDRAYLARGYRLMKGAGEFLLDWLIEDKQGRLVTAPSVSPENHFVGPNGKPLAVSIAWTMDMAIIRDVFTAVIEAGRVLGQALPRLFPLEIGKYGRPQEWLEDFEEAQPGMGTSPTCTRYIRRGRSHRGGRRSWPRGADFAGAAGSAISSRRRHGRRRGTSACGRGWRTGTRRGRG